jgi:hypothetical protein
MAFELKRHAGPVREGSFQVAYHSTGQADRGQVGKAKAKPKGGAP